MSVDDSAADTGEADDVRGVPDGANVREGRLQRRALPHRYREGALDVTIDDVRLDADTDPKVDDGGRGHRISVVDRLKWETMEIEGTVFLSDVDYEYLVPAGAREGTPPTELHVQVDCGDVILREAREVTDEAGPGVHPFVVTLERDRLYGTVTLRPTLILGDDISSTTGRYASRGGHRIADAAPITVEIDPTEPPGFLVPRRRRFSRDPDLPPESHLVHLELYGDDAPKILLNDDYPEVVDVLDTHVHQGRDARFRDVVYDYLEAQLWPQFIYATAADVGADGEPIYDWQWDVLREVAEPLFGTGTSPTEAGHRLRETLDNPDEIPRLQMKIEDFVQGRVDAPDNAESLLQEVSR